MSAHTRRTLAAAVGAGLMAACGAPKEAADPHDFIAGEMEGDRWGSGRAGGDGPEPPEAEAAAPQADPPASEAECRAAARRVLELGLRATGAPGSQSQAPTTQADRQAVVQQATDECLSWNTPRSEALCVARAERESDLEACTR